MMQNARNTPYSGRPTASPSARPSSPMSQHSQGCKVEHQPFTRPMASPQHARLPQSQPTREVPKWVRSAWTLHDKRSELMRSLSRSLPYDAMDALAPLSSVLQYTACIMLLVSPEAHSDPPHILPEFCVDGAASDSSASSLGARPASAIISGATCRFGSFRIEQWLRMDGSFAGAIRSGVVGSADGCAGPYCVCVSRSMS